MKQTLTLIAFALGFVIMGCNSHPKLTTVKSYTFVVAGDGRGKEAADQANPSGSNLPFLKKLFADVDNVVPKPEFLFFNGDLVFGFSNVVEDTALFRSELVAWLNVYKQSNLYLNDSNNIKLVIVPGNHEIDSLVDSANTKKEYPMLAKERIFVSVMGRYFVKKSMNPYILVHQGPTPQSDPQDKLGSDQSRLTYSFDYNDDHFIIFNTDPFPVGNRVPWHWLKSDLDSDRFHHTGGTLHHIFLFGHKPPYGSKYYDDGVTSMDLEPADRDSLWKCMVQYKCNIYFGSHIHLWDAFQPNYLAGIPPGPWEIVCGNAGAPMPKSMNWKPAYNNGNPYLGYTQVKVYPGDSIRINSFSMDTISANDNQLKTSFKIAQ